MAYFVCNVNMAIPGPYGKKCVQVVRHRSHLLLSLGDETNRLDAKRH